MISYEAPMLPYVDYKKIEDDLDGDLCFSLLDLEYETMENSSNFLKILKDALEKEKLAQTPELLVSYLCAYLGTINALHTVHEAVKLEPSVVELIKHQANAAFQNFNQYPVNRTVKTQPEKQENLRELREVAPGSIIVQTLRLGRVVMDVFEELDTYRKIYSKTFRPPEITDFFCPIETLTKIMLLLGGRQCAQWRKELRGLSDHYVINQMAIQIGWLIGYFSHLDCKPPDEGLYFDYGLPLVGLYRDHIYKLMHAFAKSGAARGHANNYKYTDKKW